MADSTRHCKPMYLYNVEIASRTAERVRSEAEALLGELSFTSYNTAGASDQRRWKYQMLQTTSHHYISVGNIEGGSTLPHINNFKMGGPNLEVFKVKFQYSCS